MSSETETTLRPRNWLAGACLVVATLLAYAPVWQASFIWDDDAHLTQNPCVVGPLGFKEIWTTSQAVYYPLVLTSFRILHAAFGLNPLPYHLLNVLLHAACAVLLWRILRQLEIRGAWLGAALWALHPVMVQSVAWVTELKNTQSCFFYLLAIVVFLKAESPVGNGRASWWRLAMSLMLFALAITSKSSTVMLPVVLVLCVWWRSGRLRFRDLGMLVPFFLISAAASVWTIWEQKFHSGALGPEWVQSWPQRLIVAGYDLWFYLGKLLWPERLTFIYPRWTIDASQAIAYLPIVAAVTLLALAWWKRHYRNVRPVFFAAAYFVVSLFPILGFFSVYFFIYSFVSDHFQYLASMGPLALGASAITIGLSSVAREKLWLNRGIGGVLLLTLGTLTWRQSQQYNDIETLWRTTIARNPACWMAEGNLAGLLLEKGDVDGAITHYKKAIEIWPGHAEAHNNLANALLRQGSLEEAALHFRRVLELWPNELEARNNLGGIFLQQGRGSEGIAQFEQVLARDPEHARAHNNLGNALLGQGRIEEAIAHYKKTLALPFDHAEAHYNLGNANLQRGTLEEAIAQYRQALELRPPHANAHNNLGNALERSGQFQAAISQYEEAAGLEPQSALFLNNLAWTLATCADPSLRDGARALAVADRANQLTGGANPIVLRTLAAALAENRQVPRAIETAQRALQLAKAQDNAALSDMLQREISLYQAKAAQSQPKS